MTTITMDQNDPEAPMTPESRDKGQNLTERKIGWRLFIISLISLLLTAAAWIWMHSNDWEWTGDFGKPPGQWADWVIASLAGALLYVLVNIAHWMMKPEARFRHFTPWYISMVVKGPILAWITLLFLTGVSVEISGLSINFTELEPLILVVVAFILGFYNSVTREQLNQIVKALFPKAYGTAEEQFNIVPSAVQVVFGNSVQLKTSPLTEVTWQAPNAGKLEDGLYTAPTEAKAGQIVQIVAVPKDPNIPRAFAKITLLRFEIKGESEVVHGTSERYQAVPEPAGGVTWSVSPNIAGAAISADGVYTAPSREAAEEAKLNSVTITAISTADTEHIATLRINFTQKS